VYTHLPRTGGEKKSKNLSQNFKNHLSSCWYFFDENHQFFDVTEIGGTGSSLILIFLKKLELEVL
jgi:hypothetical protein